MDRGQASWYCPIGSKKSDFCEVLVCRLQTHHAVIPFAKKPSALVEVALADNL